VAVTILATWKLESELVRDALALVRKDRQP
jgi:hypothetical protein